MPVPPSQNLLLAVRDLRTYYHTDAGFVRAVDGISFDMPPGGRVGLVGESGSGKTQTALSLLGLVDDAPGLIGGEIWLRGDNLLAEIDAYASWREEAGILTVTKDMGGWQKHHNQHMKEVRGRRVGMIFQEPRSTLIPYYTIAEHLRETMNASADRAMGYTEDAALTMLDRLRFPDPHRILESYPHTLSGGECQRIMIGLALLRHPELLIADEPTTLLDTITQRHVLDLLDTWAQAENTALLLISHNLALVRYLVDQVVVLFAGTVVEQGPVSAILHTERTTTHPYTRILMDAVADLEDLTLPPSPPRQACAPVHIPGCLFFNRCILKDQLPAPTQTKCQQKQPPPFKVGADHAVACWACEASA